MPGMTLRCLMFCVCLAVHITSAAASQERLSAADVLQLASPAADHTISYGDDELQFGKLRLPSGDGPYPIVIFIHGGCWLSQYTISHTGLAEQGLADAGFAVWSIEYRRVGDDGGGWPGTFEDVANGADFVRTLAPIYNLDLSTVIASGHSAGGYFALWLATRKRLSADHQLYMPSPVDVDAVFALAPAPDIEGLHANGVCGNVIDGLMGGSPSEYPQRYRTVSPMQLAPIDVPQALVIGAQDTSWGPVGRHYYERARAAGDSLVYVVEAPESGHFEMIVPTSSSWPIVRTALADLMTIVTRRLNP